MRSQPVTDPDTRARYSEGVLIRDEEGVRWVPLGVAACAVVVVGFLAYQRWWPTDRATQVSVEDVLGRYRDDMATAPVTPSAPVAAPVATHASEPAATTDAPVADAPVDSTLAPSTTAPPVDLTLPAPGVYVYATEGREHVTALGGTEHVYPAETTLTVTPAGCGVHVRWDLLAERYEEWNLCIADGAVVLQPDGVQFHEFYGQAQTDVAQCRAVVPLFPLPPAGTVINRDCRLAGESWNPVWTATADGYDVAITLAGEYPEDSRQHWTFRSDGLPQTIEWDMESSNPSPVGTVTYTETIVATLTTPDPLE